MNSKTKCSIKKGDEVIFFNATINGWEIGEVESVGDSITVKVKKELVVIPPHYIDRIYHIDMVQRVFEMTCKFAIGKEIGYIVEKRFIKKGVVLKYGFASGHPTCGQDVYTLLMDNGDVVLHTNIIGKANLKVKKVKS